jgi:hypothetical protein
VAVAAPRRRLSPTTLVLLVIAVVLIMAVLSGCAGQRPAVGAPADTDTCAVWTGAHFKGGGDPEQVAGARANWVALLMYEATGQEIGDTNPGDPDRAQAVRVAGGLGLYCADHPAALLTDATRTVLAEQS